MATGRVLKNLLLMSILSGALAVAAPTQAGERYMGQHHEYQQRGGDRHNGHGWKGNRRNDHHGHGGYGHRGYQRGWNGWGYRPYGYYAPPRRYYPSYYHHHYRGCGHDGYYRNGLVEFLVDYSRYDD